MELTTSLVLSAAGRTVPSSFTVSAWMVRTSGKSPRRTRNQVNPNFTSVLDQRQGDVLGYLLAPRVSDFEFELAGPNRRVRRVYDRMAGPRNVIEYPQGWHLLFRDLQAEHVWRDVADWALAQAGPACG